MTRTWLLALGVGCVGCVRAPDVVIVDRRTALEQQASGSFRGVEEELEQAALSPRPEPVTGAQLEAAGVSRGGDAGDADAAGLPDSLRVDTLLVRRCAGEARDGTLVLTVDRCTGTIDVPRANRLVERVNRNRRQLWQWLAQRTGRTPAEAQAAWREVHLTGVVCGGQVQKPDGAWEVKRC
ncbi:MAG TPA: DUF1318 domain-containing protein [Haliangiales bacterium]|nr:DUF1318 domain-containing protein [Haliangiales bacterium]